MKGLFDFFGLFKDADIPAGLKPVRGIQNSDIKGDINYSNFSLLLMVSREDPEKFFVAFAGGPASFLAGDKGVLPVADFIESDFMTGFRELAEKNISEETLKDADESDVARYYLDVLAIAFHCTPEELENQMRCEKEGQAPIEEACDELDLIVLKDLLQAEDEEEADICINYFRRLHELGSLSMDVIDFLNKISRTALRSRAENAQAEEA